MVSYCRLQQRLVGHADVHALHAVEQADHLLHGLQHPQEEVDVGVQGVVVHDLLDLRPAFLDLRRLALQPRIELGTGEKLLHEAKVPLVAPHHLGVGEEACHTKLAVLRARRRLGDGPVHGQRLLLRIHGLDCVPDGRPHVSKLRDAPRLRAHTLDRHGRLGRADVLAHEIHAMGRIDDARDVGHLLLDVGEGRLAGTIKPEHEVDVDASRFAHALDGEARLVFCVLRVARRVDALHKARALGNMLDEVHHWPPAVVGPAVAAAGRTVHLGGPLDDRPDLVHELLVQRRQHLRCHLIPVAERDDIRLATGLDRELWVLHLHALQDAVTGASAHGQELAEFAAVREAHGAVVLARDAHELLLDLLDRRFLQKLVHRRLAGARGVQSARSLLAGRRAGRCGPLAALHLRGDLVETLEPLKLRHARSDLRTRRMHDVIRDDRRAAGVRLVAEDAHALFALAQCASAGGRHARILQRRALQLVHGFLHEVALHRLSFWRSFSHFKSLVLSSRKFLPSVSRR